MITHPCNQDFKFLSQPWCHFVLDVLPAYYINDLSKSIFSHLAELIKWKNGVDGRLSFSGLRTNCAAIVQTYRCSLFLVLLFFSHQCQVTYLIRLSALSTSCLEGECAASSVKGEAFPDAEGNGPEHGEGESCHPRGFHRIPTGLIFSCAFSRGYQRHGKDAGWGWGERPRCR